MRRFALIILLLCIPFFFSGCNDNNPTDPQLNISEQDNTLFGKRIITTFEGESNFVLSVSPGRVVTLPNGNQLTIGAINNWYETTDDPRVTGPSTWYINKNIKPDGTGKAWGRAEIFVEGGLGKWELSWNMDVMPTGLFGHAHGVGKEGVVKGLVADWTYSMNFLAGFFYTSSGSIKSH